MGDCEFVAGEAMKQRFTAVVSQKDGRYVVLCLEVDVASQGDSQELALENLMGALGSRFDELRPTVFPQA